jgi:RND family efflux transporter MFP subunit
MKKILLVILIIAFIAGLMWFFYPQITPVRVTAVKRGVISKIIPEDGLVRTKEETNINSEVSGKIEKLLVDEGKDIRAGDIIAEIEKTYLDALVTQAESGLLSNDKLIKELKSVFDKARLDYERMKSLAKEGSISQQTLEESEIAFDRANQSYESAKATRQGLKAYLNSAKDQLTKATIRSPIDGVVTLVQRKQGETVIPGMPLMRIINPKSAYIEIEITDSDMGEIKVGQPVRITADGCPGQEFNGTLNQIMAEGELKANQIDVSSLGKERIFRGVVKMTEHPDCLKPGMSLYGDVIVESKDNVLIVPRNSVISESNNFYVYVVKDGHAEKKEIRVGIKESENVEIIQGLNEGDTIVIEGFEKLKNGRRVNVK